MTIAEAEPTTITIRHTNIPARQLPAGLWIDVLAVLKAHGLDAAPSEVTSALSLIVRHTPVDKGGRLLPDGEVDTSEWPDMPQSWYCTRCLGDYYSVETKAGHDRWCS